MVFRITLQKYSKVPWFSTIAQQKTTPLSVLAQPFCDPFDQQAYPGSVSRPVLPAWHLWNAVPLPGGTVCPVPLWPLPSAAYLDRTSRFSGDTYSYLDWYGLKVVREFKANGPLKFVFQYIYYGFEVAHVQLIIVFGHEAFEHWFSNRLIPYGGMLVNRDMRRVYSIIWLMFVL